MTKAKTTRHALLMSVLSMMLCMAMLVGSTFAWFTDTVTSGVNKIVAGNLDVEMDYAVLNDDGSIKEWKNVEGVSLFDEKALWEPGYTQVVHLRVRNVGSLSLNYKLSVNVANEKAGKRYDKEAQKEINFLLSDYLKFGAVTDWDGTNAYADRAAARAAIGEDAGKLKNYSATGSIKASEKETDIKYIALVVYMPEEVGNEANHYKTFAPEITLGIELFATQMMDEKDSFGDDYDKNAFQNDEQTPAEEDAFADLTQDTFTVKTEADLLKLQDLVLNGTTFEGKTITLANDITLSQANWKPIGSEYTPFKGTFDGDQHTISGLKITEFGGSPESPDGVGLFGVVERATIKNITVEGNISLKGTPAELFEETSDPVIVSAYIGGICGKDKNGSTFDTCTNRVEISVTGVNMTQVGGILGVAYGTNGKVQILNSTNDANITVDNTLCQDSYVGGITSASVGSFPVIIRNCTHNTDKTVSGGNFADNICNGTYTN